MRDLDAVKNFHGHMCVGLALGIRAAEAGMRQLGKAPSPGELLILSETDSCPVDAFQVLTGCTTGKGDLIVTNNGKSVFTFFVPGRKAVRVAAKAPTVAEPSYKRLFSLLGSGADRSDNLEQFAKLQRDISADVLAMPEPELLSITEVVAELPQRPDVGPSHQCGNCGERTMEAYLIETPRSLVCLDCVEVPAEWSDSIPVSAARPRR